MYIKVAARVNLILGWLSIIQRHDMIEQRPQLLGVLVVSDANDWNFRGFNSLNQVSNSASVAGRHPINLVHDKYDLGAAAENSVGDILFNYVCSFSANPPCFTRRSSV